MVMVQRYDRCPELPDNKHGNQSDFGWSGVFDRGAEQESFA